MMTWQPIETAPKCSDVLIAFKNGLGQWQLTTAAYFLEATLEASFEYDGGIYDEEQDTYFCPAGWYERVAAETGLPWSLHALSEVFPTHWMPLPPPPVVDEAAE